MSCPHVRLDSHPLDDPGYRDRCRDELEAAGVMVLEGFFTQEAVAEVVTACTLYTSDAAEDAVRWAAHGCGSIERKNGEELRVRTDDDT